MICRYLSSNSGCSVHSVTILTLAPLSLKEIMFSAFGFVILSVYFRGSSGCSISKVPCLPSSFSSPKFLPFCWLLNSSSKNFGILTNHAFGKLMIQGDYYQF
eukprot:NODE_776_length_3975_cov_0.468008.p5 type:complete len:102 gc:universal NODE_776_length_3975_cov_0.468008:1881-1576(-)